MLIKHIKFYSSLFQKGKVYDTLKWLMVEVEKSVLHENYVENIEEFKSCNHFDVEGTVFANVRCCSQLYCRPRRGLQYTTTNNNETTTVSLGR